MKFTSSRALCAVALLIAFAQAAIPGHRLHEIRRRSENWVKRRTVSPDAVLPMRIGLTQQNLDRGYDVLMDVSHPSSPNYAKHWTSEEVADFFAPSDEAVAEVKAWLVEAGIPANSIVHADNKGWLAFDATASEAESLLHTHYHEFEYQGDGGHVSLGCDEYHVPATISHHIDYIVPGVKLSPPMKRQQKRSSHHSNDRHEKRNRPGPGLPGPVVEPIGPSVVDNNGISDCDKLVTPRCIRALYDIPRVEYKKAIAGNQMAVYESGDVYDQEDLNLFFENYARRIPHGTHPSLDSIDGGKAPTTFRRSGVESLLDMQISYPIIYPQNLTLYQVDDRYYTSHITLHSGEFNTFLDAIDGSYCSYSAYGIKGDSRIDPKYPDPHKGGYKGKLMCGKYKAKHVISISYGVQEDDLPANYQKRQCNEFMKLGLQGSSIFVASGDTGVAGIDRFPCLGPKHNIFNPTNPNTCPYVTNVGSTNIPKGKTVHHPEEGASFSSGGFSNIYGIPGYQKEAIASYFKHHDPGYNRIGRALPDLAATGTNIAIYVGRRRSRGSGTSASSPLVAAIVNRINEARLRAGKKPVGFINHALYAHPEMLNDITSGNNPGCRTKGFSAVKGWDPVTGLGTPNYPKMLKYFMSLP